MRSLLKYFKKYRVQCFVGPLFKLLEVVFELLVPVIIASIIDNGILKNDVNHIYKSILILVIFSVIGFSCTLLAQYLSAYASVNISSDIREAAFKKVLSLKTINLEKYGSSRVLNTITSDINQIQLGINLVLRLLLRSPFVVVGAIIMAFTFDKRLALIYIGVVLVLAIIIAINFRKSIPAYKDARLELDNVVTETDDALNGVRVIRGFVQTENEFCNFKEHTNKLNILQKAAAKINTILNPATFLIVNGCICLLIYFGAIEVSIGVLTSGAVVALYNYMNQILVELIKLTNLIIQVSRALACSNRVATLLDYEEPSIDTDVEFEKENYVEFDNVSFSYNNDDAKAISNISFKLKKGDSLGIIGKTGSGKSTIGAILAGLYEQTSGSVRYSDSVNPTVGYTLQKTRLFNDTIKFNICLNRENITEDDLKFALDVSCCTDFVKTVDLVLNEGGKNLSGGQRQRIGIARAIVTKPDILILDDASASLDAITEKKFIDNLSKIPYELTKVIISQKIKSVKSCDSIIVLDEGRLIDIGNHDQLISRCEIYREMNKLQTREAEL